MKNAPKMQNEVKTTTTIDTKSKIKNDGELRLPHERDEAPDAQNIEPRKIIKQAYSDLKKGLVDTDLHGKKEFDKLNR